MGLLLSRFSLTPGEGAQRGFPGAMGRQIAHIHYGASPLIYLAERPAIRYPNIIG